MFMLYELAFKKRGSYLKHVDDLPHVSLGQVDDVSDSLVGDVYRVL